MRRRVRILCEQYVWVMYNDAFRALELKSADAACDDVY